MSGIRDEHIEKLLNAAFHSGTEAQLLARDEVRTKILAEGAVERIGEFEVLAVLGVGGTSWVYRVRDPDLDRPIALKVLHSAVARDERMVRQFEREAVLCGRLAHPGVVPIHGRGKLDDGRPYFTMRIIDGEDLATVLCSRSHAGSNLVQLLEIFLKICQVLAHAHEHSIVHLDLKPQNVRVGRFGEVQVVDWGFAHCLLDATPPMRIGGTPAYMAPEQATRDGRAIGRHTDVFGLGGLLCEILTGLPPYDVEAREEAVLAASQGWLEEAWARLDACGADLVLRELAVSCLQRDPADRPRDAAALVECVQGHLLAVEERAHASELAAAETRGLLRQERRARRITLIMSSVIVALLAVFFAIYHAMESERLERSLHVEAALDEAIGDVEERRVELAAADDSRKALERLRATLERLRTLAGSPEITPSARRSALEKVEELDAEIVRVERELTFREAAARLKPHAGSKREAQRFEDAYQKLFHDLGCGAVADIAVMAGLRPESLRACLWALDDWSSVRYVGSLDDDGGWQRILLLAHDLDVDPWRQQVRRLTLSENGAQLVPFAEDPATLLRDVESLDLLARWLAAFGETEHAVRLYRAAHRRWPESSVIAHNLACQLERSADPPRDEIYLLYSTVLALEPRDGHVRIDLALNRLEAGEPERALEWLDEVADGGGESDRYGLVRGLVLERLDRLDDAMQSYRQAWQHGSRPSGHRLVQLLTDHGRIDEAVTFLREVLEATPSDVYARYLLGTEYLRCSQLTLARRLLREVLDETPTFAEALCNYGMALVYSGELAEGFEFLRQGHERGDAQSDWAYPSEMWVRETEAELEAVDRLERMLVLGTLPSDPRTCLGLAFPALHLGYPELSLRLFASFLRSQDIPDDLLRGARMQAVRAALLAGLGLGEFGVSPTAATRCGYRDRAVEWLREDLQWIAENLDPKQARAHLLRTRRQPELTFLRWSPHLPWSVAVMTPEERERWLGFEERLNTWIRELGR
ncbi:MAG: protein kinase [Planctomycetes bacterium]|nr:protein kinase [Planctomycetota bacterium]